MGNFKRPWNLVTQGINISACDDLSYPYIQN